MTDKRGQIHDVWVSAAQLDPDVINHQEQPVEATPGDECRPCPVPQPTQQHYDHQVRGTANAELTPETR